MKFFFKQWGEWAPIRPVLFTKKGKIHVFEDKETVWWVGKKFAGATLDGWQWQEMPGKEGGKRAVIGI